MGTITNSKLETKQKSFLFKFSPQNPSISNFIYNNLRPPNLKVLNHILLYTIVFPQKKKKKSKICNPKIWSAGLTQPVNRLETDGSGTNSDPGPITGHINLRLWTTSSEPVPTSNATPWINGLENRWIHGL